MKHTYVDCHVCKWRLERQPDFNWIENPCQKCKNTRKIINPKEILCNMCGESMCHEIIVPSGTWKCSDPHGLYNAQVTGEYESYHLFDLTQYTFSICELCLRNLFIQFKIKPKVNDLIIDSSVSGSSATFSFKKGEELSWENDLEYYEYRIWKDNGGYHQAYIDGKCNVVKDCPNKAIYTLTYDGVDFTEGSVCEEHKNKCSNNTFTKFIPNKLKPFL